jgi:hypothetical protein
MSETGQTCEAYGNRGLSQADERRAICPNGYVRQWVPMPAPPAPVTIAAVDTLLSRFSILLTAATSWENAAAAMLRALRPLVERKQCEDRIVAVGYRWEAGSGHDAKLGITILGGDSPRREHFSTWPAAADWAEAQAAPKERWSKPIEEMNEQEVIDTLLAIGVTDPYARSSNQSHRRGYLRGYARDRWDRDTDRVKLPEEAARRVVPDKDGGL